MKEPKDLEWMPNTEDMKKFFTVVLVVFVGIIMLSSVMQRWALAADDPPAKIPAVAPTDEPKALTDKCATVREKVKPVKDDVLTEEQKRGQVSVYLSESIEANNYGMSCSQIISCMRTARIMMPDEKNRISSNIQEMLIIRALRTEYPACILEAKDGLSLLSKYATIVYKWIAGIVGAICILVIVISGIQISIGGLSQEEVSGAKDRISRSLIGMVVLFLSAFILYTINPIFFT